MGSFRIIAYLYVTNGRCRWLHQSTEKKYSVFIYSETEPHAICTLYINRRYIVCSSVLLLFMLLSTISNDFIHSYMFLSLTLLMLRLRYVCPKFKDTNIFEKHLHPFMLVIFGKLLLSILSDEYPCARVSIIFQFFCIIFVSAKLATSSIRVRSLLMDLEFVYQHLFLSLLKVNHVTAGIIGGENPTSQKPEYH